MDWTTDPRFGTDDRPVGSTADLEALCRRRLAEIVGPAGLDVEGQIFRYERECSRYYAVTGASDDDTPWMREGATPEDDPLTVAYRRAFGADRWADEDQAEELYDRHVGPATFDGGKAAEAHPWQLREPEGSLDDLLAEGDDLDPPWLIDGVWPHGGKVVLAAPAKAGKSTLIGNVVRSLADGAPLFGPPVDGVIGDTEWQAGYRVTPLAEGETIYLADVELSRGQLRRWLRDQGINNQHRIRYGLYRGRAAALDVRDPDVRARLAARLRAQRTRVIIIDPVGVILAALDLNESSNPEVRRYLAALESLALEAGVGEILVVHHAGHGGERARGASAWRDWPDAEWRLIRPETGEGREAAADAPRYFAAAGRDVAVPETALRYDGESRHLSLVTGDRDTAAVAQHSGTVVDVVTGAPGITTRNLEAAVKNRAHLSTAKARQAVAAARTSGQIHQHDGPGKALAHYPGADSGTCRCTPHDQAAA